MFRFKTILKYFSFANFWLSTFYMQSFVFCFIRVRVLTAWQKALEERFVSTIEFVYNSSQPIEWLERTIILLFNESILSRHALNKSIASDRCYLEKLKLDSHKRNAFPLFSKTKARVYTAFVCEKWAGFYLQIHVA